MTAPGPSRGVESLTALNIRLIGQLSDTAATGSTPAEQAAENDILKAGDVEGYEDPDTTGEDEAEIRGRFSAEDPFEFNLVKEWLEGAVFEGGSGDMAPLIGAFINEWAESLAGEPIYDADGNIVDHKYPSAQDIITNLDFQQGASFLPFRSQFEALPPAFRTTTPDEEGNPIPVIVINDPLKGPQFIEDTFQPEREAIRTTTPTGPRVTIRTPTGQPLERSRVMRTPSEGGAAGAAFADTIEPGSEATPSEIRGTTLTAPGSQTTTVATPSEMRGVPVGPFVPPEVLESILNPAPSTSGGGGGGGAGRKIEFDRDHLIAQVTERYNETMLDPNEAPSALVSSIVDGYIREAKAFWVNKGGQMDFDTYVWAKLRAIPRYKEIYKHKTHGQTEAAFLQSFMAPIGGFGMTPEFTRRQTEIAVQTNTGPTAQAQRVSRTREVQNQGGFSQRLAQTIAGLGVRS